MLVRNINSVSSKNVRKVLPLKSFVQNLPPPLVRFVKMMTVVKFSGERMLPTPISVPNRRMKHYSVGWFPL